MSGPWEKYASSPETQSGPWSKYAGAGDAGLSLDVTPDAGIQPAPRLADVMAAPGAAANYMPGPLREKLLAAETVKLAPGSQPLMPNADAAGEAMLGSLASGASSLPLAMGGAANLVGAGATRDHFFDSTAVLRDLGAALKTEADGKSKAGATLGGVAAILPQLLTPATLAAQIVSGGTEPALHALDKGADVATAEKLLGVGTVGNAAANLLPVGAGGSALTRALLGGVTNAGAGYAIPAAEHAIAPEYAEAPTAQDVIQQGGIGALLAAALGHGAPAHVAGETLLQPDAEPMGLPRGADFTARAERARATPPPVDGAVHVAPGGDAFTPEQGRNAFGEAMAAAINKPVTPALPEPVVAVDRSGNALTTADQHAAMQPKAPVEDLAAALGLTPGALAAQAKDARTARPGAPIPPKGLPAPAIAVDSGGTAMTSADFLAKAKQAQEAAQQRTDLGITPDIERTQGTRWAKQDQQVREAEQRRQALAEVDQQQTALEAANKPATGRNARPDEITDDALTFLAKSGGLARTDFIKQGIDPAETRMSENRRRGGITRPLFRASDGGGMSLDHAAETLWQHGYLHSQDNNAALDLIMGSLRGEPAYSAHRAHQDDLLSLEQQRRDIEAEPVHDYADVPFSRKRAPSESPAFSFGGERARTADRSSLEHAQQMEAMGRDSAPDGYGNQPGSPEDTHIATGWHRGADGKWRFEIDDSKANLKDAIALKDQAIYTDKRDFAQRAIQRSLRDGDIDEAERLQAHVRDLRTANQKELSVADVLDHPDLLAAYPELANVPVRIDHKLGGSWGAYNPSTNSIEIRPPSEYPPSGARSLKSVLLHEIQHAIQSHEGFARGGSMTEFARPRMAERDHLNAEIQRLNAGMSEANGTGDKATYEQLMRERRDVVRQLHENGLASDIDIQERSHRDYHRLAGEVEARNTQARLGMSAEDRRTTPPTETADVPRDKQIVRLNSEPGERRDRGHHDAAVTERASKGLSDYIGKRVELVPAAAVPDTVRRALEEFDRVFGGRTVVVENRTPDALSFEGVNLGKGYRFVDAAADAPLLTITAHEMLHSMQQDRPDLYEELAAEVDRHGRVAAYGAVLRERAKASGERPEAISEETVRSELVADAVGDALTDPAFLEGLAKRNPSLFRRAAEYILDSLRRVISKLRTLGSNAYLGDVEAFRKKLEDVLERYAQHKQGERQRDAQADEGGRDQMPAPRFSRKPATDEFSHLNDMPSRRPGESQNDYTRRVMRKNGDEVKAALQLAKMQRDIGRLGMRAMWAKQDRALAIADHAFAEYRRLFDKEDQAINLRTIDQWETGQKITDADARQFFDTMKEAFDQRTAKIQALAPDAMQQLVDHYFPHIWEDSAKAMKWYQGFSAKRPMQGDRSFLKQRVHATIADGMATGLKPISTNPVDLAMLKLGQMDKFIAFHEFRADLQQRGWLRKMDAGERVPVGYARVDDPAFQIAGGLQGYHAVPELIARDINNYLSPSLYRFGAWKALRTVQNVLMSSRLGLSMFHGGFTTMDNLVMHADVAGRRLMLGDLAGGLGTLLKAPLSIVWSPIEGEKLNKEWLGLNPSDQHTAAVMDMLEQGGAHMKMSATDYNNAIPKLVKAVRQKSATGTLKQTLPAISEAISWVIHHKLVPNQKMAARVMLAKFELDRVAGTLGKKRGDYAGIIDALHPDALKQVAAHVVDLVDDRLGQMNYDNQFWNKTAREVAQAAIGAVGWQVGTLRTVTGGARDLVHLWSPKKLLSTLDKAGNLDGDLGRVSGRLTYLVTLALLMGGLSAVTQYFLTGKGPSEAKDYFFPKTGNTNDDGSDERLQWPSYWSDHYKLATHPLQTAMHKINPSIGMLMEALSNQDYFGTEIRNPDDAWWKQAGEVGEYLAKGFIPYSITGAQKNSDTGVSAGRQVANFFGITKAPASVSRSKFQAFVADKAYDAMPQGSRSQAQTEHSQAMHAAESAIRRGQTPDMEGLTDADRRNVDKAARQETPAIRFRRLGIEDKLRAYDLATPDERERYQLAPMILRSNWHKAIRDLPDDERDAVLAKIQALTP